MDLSPVGQTLLTSFQPRPGCSTLSFMNINSTFSPLYRISTDQAGVSPFQWSELEKRDFEVVRLLPALEDVLQPVLDHLPLRLLHLINQNI